MNLLAEYIYVKQDAQLRTWGSALIFGTGNLQQNSLNKNQSFLRIGLSPKFILSKNLDIGIKINQWVPIGVKGKGSNTKTRGGTFGQIVVSYSL